MRHILRVCAVITLLSLPTIASAQLPIPNNDTRGLFLSFVGDKPFGQATLTALESTLAQYCIALTPPNAAGDRTKIGDPISHRWTRVGFGEGHWVWIVQGDEYTPVCAPPPPPPPVLPTIDLSGVIQRLDQILNKLDHQFGRQEELAINNVNEHHATQDKVKQHDEHPTYLAHIAGFITNPTFLAIIGSLVAGRYAIK